MDVQDFHIPIIVFFYFKKQIELKRILNIHQIIIYISNKYSMSWSEYSDNRGSCLVYQSQKTSIKTNETENDKIKVIGLNLEWNIVRPNGLGFWISNFSDWTYCYDILKLREYHNNGYQIVIFTNQIQLGGKGHLAYEEFRSLIMLIDKYLNIPFQAFIATKNGYFVKPVTGLWDVFLQLNNISKFDIDHKKSLYIGSQAGRMINSHGKKDFSCIDYYFSQNIGLCFRTPEQFFLESKDSKHMKLPVSFHPYYYLTHNCDNYEEKLHEFKSVNEMHIVMLVGSPASGKSRLCQKYLSEHIRINQDTLKTVNRCFKAAIIELEKGNSLIIDNTNRDKKIRQKWIELAKKYNIPIDCIYMKNNRNMTLHFNSYRNLSKSKNKVPDIAIYSYFSKLEPPVQEEGFRRFVKLQFDSNFSGSYTKEVLSGYIRGKYSLNRDMEGVYIYRNNWKMFGDNNIHGQFKTFNS
jgi:bifunctional polynucleotide phosphatase/kinase